MLLGADALGSLVPGQIIVGAPTAIVTVISDPVLEQPQLRGRRDHGYRVALAASGEVRTIVPVIPSFGWYSGLSIPTTRPKLPARHQQTIALWPFPAIDISWFNNLSTPQKLQKQGTEPSLQQYLAFQAPLPTGGSLLLGWYNWFSDPVRLKPALNTSMQSARTGPDRLLPTPSVTATISAFEVNGDQAIIAIRIFPYNPPASAVVSIVEVGSGESATSIWEN